jgi:hypothetical protein
MITRQLIANAYYLSGILSRDFETISDTQAVDGLDILNDILAEKSISSALIPYYTQTIYQGVAGTKEFIVPDLVNETDVTFFIDNVRYKMIRDSQQRFWGDSRVEDISSLPFHYYSQRAVGGMQFYLYFTPDADYRFEITGKYRIETLTLDIDSSFFLDRFYVSYLKYKLAKRLCDFYGHQFPGQLEPTLKGLEAQLNKMVGVDLTIEKPSNFSRGGNFSYGQANLGKGWEP